MKIFFLQVMSYFNKEEHYENVYLNKKRAIKEGKEWLKKLRNQYKDMFDDNNGIEEFDFEITEFDPEENEESYDIKNIPVVKDYDIYDLYCAELNPLKIIHSYNFNGKEIYISGVYIFKYKGKRKERTITMKYKDYINPNAGTKFKIGDIVRIKKYQDSHNNYAFKDKLHVIKDVPHKKENQEFFSNTYKVVVNHNSYDEGCHVDIFNENELELYTGKLSDDSPILFLSDFLKEKMKIKNISWNDLECGKIVLNENKSFRDVIGKTV